MSGWTPRPAEPYTSESEKGNTKAISHGAYSSRLLEVTVTEIVSELETDVPWIAETLDAPEVRSWLLAEARVRRLATYVNENEELDDDSHERDASKVLARWVKVAADHRDRLGLNPTARMRLAHDFAGRAAPGRARPASRGGGKAQARSRAQSGPQSV